MLNVTQGLSSIDIGVFAVYVLVVISVGLWVSRDKKGARRVQRTIYRVWAIGASLIAANISAEQFIGMSGSGYSIGLAIASYEWIGKPLVS